MFYMISHNNILKFLETLWDVEKTCFSQHTGGTAGAIFNVLDCESRDPVLVIIRSKIVFTVILSRPLSQLEHLSVSCKECALNID